MVELLDANVLIALVVADHVHHAAVERWHTETDGQFATCPITQGALVRFLLREAVSGADARQVVGGVVASERHRFWEDHIGFQAVNLDPVVGHRQVTDAYLAQLARARRGRLATIDRGLAAAHPDVASLVPV